MNLINNRYKIIDILGKGGFATTYRALDIKNNTEVALKTISLKRVSDWKQIELFAREAQVLKQIKHPGIPRYLDYFEVDNKRDRYFYLVQELAPGKSLFELVNDGWQPDSKEVKQIAVSILKILIYLQKRSPPIIHRDIKPQNIIRAENGEVVLVDFGAVANIYNQTFKSTVVGTFGYMSPEQFRGKATLNTDIYGLGTTLLFLLTGKCPAELPQYRLKINFRSYINTNTHFIHWLEKAIAPDVSQRFHDAKDALDCLEGKLSFIPAKTIERPINSVVTLKKEHDRLVIQLPGLIRFKSLNFWIAFIIGLLVYLVSIADPDVLFTKVAYFIIVTGVVPPMITILVVSSYFIICWLFGKKITIYSKESRIQNLNFTDRVELRQYKIPLIKKSIAYCCMVGALKHTDFGFLLTREENEWLAQEINDFLARD